MTEAACLFHFLMNGSFTSSGNIKSFNLLSTDGNTVIRRWENLDLTRFSNNSTTEMLLVTPEKKKKRNIF